MQKKLTLVSLWFRGVREELFVLTDCDPTGKPHIDMNELRKHSRILQLAGNGVTYTWGG